MVRWASALAAIVLCVLLITPFAFAHKSPVIEYGRSGVWRTAYSFTPRQPIVNEPVTVTEQVSHLNGTIEGNVTMVFSIYQDSSVNKWYGGKQYKYPDWQLLSSAPGQPMPGEDHKFSSQVVIGRPGNYFVTVDLYEDGQYVGQDMRSLDVEQPTIGPLFTVFSVLLIIAVLWGVRKGIL